MKTSRHSFVIHEEFKMWMKTASKYMRDENKEVNASAGAKTRTCPYRARRARRNGTQDPFTPGFDAVGV